MVSNAQRFSILVCELRDLLEQYMLFSEDAKENPVSHYTLLNLLLAIQILEKYAKNDPNAVSLMKSLSDKHLEILSSLQKH